MINVLKYFFCTKKHEQRPIFAITIVGAEELNFWVRDGARWTLFAIVTRISKLEK